MFFVWKAQLWNRNKIIFTEKKKKTRQRRRKKSIVLYSCWHFNSYHISQYTVCVSLALQARCTCCFVFSDAIKCNDRIYHPKQKENNLAFHFDTIFILFPRNLIALQNPSSPTYVGILILSWNFFWSIFFLITGLGHEKHKSFTLWQCHGARSLAIPVIWNDNEEAYNERLTCIYRV